VRKSNRQFLELRRDKEDHGKKQTNDGVSLTGLVRPLQKEEASPGKFGPDNARNFRSLEVNFTMGARFSNINGVPKTSVPHR